MVSESLALPYVGRAYREKFLYRASVYQHPTVKEKAFRRKAQNTLTLGKLVTFKLRLGGSDAYITERGTYVLLPVSENTRSTSRSCDCNEVNLFVKDRKNTDKSTKWADSKNDPKDTACVIMLEELINGV